MTIHIVTNKPKGSHPGIWWELTSNRPTSHQLYRSRVSHFKICTKVPVIMGKACPHAQFTTHLSPLLFSSNSPQPLHGPSNGNPLICFCFTRKDASDPFIHYSKHKVSATVLGTGHNLVNKSPNFIELKKDK